MRLVLAAALLGLVGCRDNTRTCPSRSWQDPAREARVLSLVTGDVEGARLDRSRARALCFGPGAAGVVTTDGVLLLDASQQDAALAARAAHLLEHLRRAAAWSPGRTCTEQASDARADEQQARGLEDRMRARLGLAPEPMGDLDVVQAEALARCEAALGSGPRSQPSRRPWYSRQVK